MIGGMGFGRGRFGVLCVFSLLSLAYPSTSAASEVCTDRDEFVHFAQQHKLLKQQNKVQADLIKEIKAWNATLEERDAVNQRYKEAAEPLIEELANQREQYIKENAELRTKNAEQEKLQFVEKVEIVGATLIGAATARWGGKHLWRIGKRMMGR